MSGMFIKNVLNYNYLTLFVGILGLLQIIYTGITYDESYYWVYSNFLSFGYYDHPPMVALMIWIGELFGHGVFFTRLAFLLMSLGSLHIMSKLVSVDNRVLLLVAFFSFPLLSASQIFALPDTPLLFFTVLLWYLVEKYQEQNTLGMSFLIGVTISLLFYSKYHGMLIVIFTVLGNLNLIKRKSFYFIILTVFICYLPHMIWQYQNDFVSFKFHLTGRKEKHFNVENIANYILGVLAVSGIIFTPYYLKKMWKTNTFKKNKMYTYNSIGFFGFVLLLSFRNQIELNWIVTATAAVLILILRDNQFVNQRRAMLMLIPSLLIVVVMRVILINDFGLRKTVNRLNEIHGWDERFMEYENIDKNSNIVFDNYQYGSIFSYHYDKVYPVLHLRSRESHYSLLNLTKKYNIIDDEIITFVGTKKVFDSYKIETNYKDPVYVDTDVTINEIKDKYLKR